MWLTLQGLAEIAFMLYNNTGDQQCFVPWAESNDPTDEAWTYQTCSELATPQGTYGVPNDMFPVREFSYRQFNEFCLRTYGVKTDIDWYRINYGFTEFYVESLRNLSNIVFSYGTYDPWQSGCLKEAPNPNVAIIGITGAAHHFDLRRPNSNDPLSVIFARKQEQKYIEQWIVW